MDNFKNDNYYLKKIVNDIDFIIEHTEDINTSAELKKDEILLDSVLFRLIQISENLVKLTESFKNKHREVPWRAIKGMRNRVIHDYGEVDIEIVYETVKVSLPELVDILKKFCQ